MVLGGMAGVAHLFTGHEQTQKKRVCYFQFFDVVICFQENLFNTSFVLHQSAVVQSIVSVTKSLAKESISLL